MNTSMKLTVISGYLACRMYKAGSVKIAPDTIIPEQAPILWIMTFSPKAPLRRVAPATPTAIMVMGMAASNTWPTFRPKYAVAAENRIAIPMPQSTDQRVTSLYCLPGDIKGSYVSPGFSSRKAFSGKPVNFS